MASSLTKFVTEFSLIKSTTSNNKINEVLENLGISTNNYMRDSQFRKRKEFYFYTKIEAHIRFCI